MIDTNLDGKITQAELEINDAIEILRTSKVKISDDSSDDSEGSGLMHHKFVIVDNKITVITSANFTPSCIHGDISSKSSRGNANSMMVVESPEFSKLFTEEFKQLWARKFGLNKKYRPMKMVSVDGINIKVKFSPTSLSGHYTKTTNGLIVSELKKAKEKIEAALFVFSEQQIANAMDDNSFHPEVSVMVENKFAFRYYSELLDLFGVQRKAPEGGYEINNRPWKKPLEFGGAVKLDKGDVMHHKFAVLDNKKVIMGSHNWSESANTQNDEFLVVIEDIQTASRFSQEFARMKNYASPKVPETN
jgi:phosphatidylserine/phosphatidylglycerophosphate/cardiolipin synthase-like enzyme